MNANFSERILRTLFLIVFVSGTVWTPQAIVRAQQGPILEWQVVLDSSTHDEGWAIAVDGSGNSYIAGYSEASWGDPIRQYTGGQDGFVAKLDADGEIVWNTFLGTSSVDMGKDVVIDEQGFVYVLGEGRGNWGTPIRPNTNQTYYLDAFVAKFDNAGTLLWNTFLGAMGTDQGYGISLDNSGNIYVNGESSNLWGNPVNAPHGNVDAFVAKLDNDGNLLWNAYVGGTGADFSYENVTDVIGNVFISGLSYSTWGTPIRAYSGGEDVFVTKLNSEGILQWNTFIGSPNNERGQGIAIDNEGNLYLGGEGTGIWGAPINSYSGDSDIFAAKLDEDGNLQWNTFLGTTGFDVGRAVTVDKNGNIYLTGRSDASWGTPTTPFSGAGDIFLAQLTNSGNLNWNAFWGTIDYEQGTEIDLDNNGNIYIAGGAGVYTTYEILVAKIRAVNTPPVADAGGPYTIESGESFTLDGSGSTDPDNNIILYEWDLNVDGIYDITGANPSVTFTEVGDKLVTLRVIDADGLSDMDTATVTIWPEILHVAPGGLTNGTCEIWTNACELQYALTNSISGQEIWAAAGVYKPGADRTTSFQLKSGVELYGGFAGTEINRDQRDWQTNPTILSGDIDNNDFNADGNFIAETWNDIRGANSYHVVWNKNLNETAVLDGFVITAGQASGYYPYNNGAGMLNENSHPILMDLIISGNVAEQGGGMRNDHSNPTLTNISFVGNHVDAGGGGLANDYCQPILKNVTFSHNSAGGYGGGMVNDFSTPTFIAITVSNNSASHGGGITNNNDSFPVLKNVIIWGNSATSSGNQIFNADNSTPSIAYSDIQGSGGTGANWDVLLGTDNGGNIDANPLFVDTPNKNFHLQDSSPAIDTGTNTGCPAADFDGILRPQDGNNDGSAICDMGAYEYNRPADSTPPVIALSASGTLGSNNWYTSNVMVTWTVDDPESGIASSTGCDLSTLSTETTGMTLTCTATNGAGLASSESVTIKIDKIPPVITWSGNINNGESFFFNSVPLAPTCAAEDHYSGTAGACTVSGYATMVGTHTLTTSVQDLAGNTASEYRTYTVMPWTLNGFYQPVDMNGVFNVAKNGSTIPFKFEIFKETTKLTELTDTFFIKGLTYAAIACDATSPSDEIEMTATGSTSLRYDLTAGQFIYNWKTPNTVGKCYRVTMTAIDGSSMVAYFKLK